MEGWEDGQSFKRKMDKLDRWTTQNADTLHISINEKLSVSIKQDPHSKHLGGYISFFLLYFFFSIISLISKDLGYKHHHE